MQQSKRGAEAEAEEKAQHTAKKAKGEGDAAEPAFDPSFGKAAKPDADSGEDEPDADTLLTDLIKLLKEKNGRDPTDAEVAQWMEQIAALNEPQSGDDEDEDEEEEEEEEEDDEEESEEGEGEDVGGEDDEEEDA